MRIICYTIRLERCETVSVIGDNIKKYRVIKQLTQQQVADAVGKTKNVVSNWEKGLNKPDVDTVEVLCGLFEVDANTLLGWNDKSQIKKDANDLADKVLSNPKVQKLLPLLDLNEEDTKLISGFIERLTKDK